MRSEVYPLKTLRSPIAIGIMYLSTVDSKEKKLWDENGAQWLGVFFRFAVT